MENINMTCIEDLSEPERKLIACVLKTYFPELGTDEEMEGGDTVETLNHIFEHCGFTDLNLD